MFYKLPNSKAVNIYVLCAVTMSGVLAYWIKVSSFKSCDVLEFIRSQLPIIKPIVTKFIVMDNASIHRTAALKKFFVKEITF